MIDLKWITKEHVAREEKAPEVPAAVLPWILRGIVKGARGQAKKIAALEDKQQSQQAEIENLKTQIAALSRDKTPV